MKESVLDQLLGNGQQSLTAIRERAANLAEVFRLPLRDQRWHGRAGELSGTGVGNSLEFQDHRDYIPGDDPRHINWNAFARNGQLTMKQFREEVQPLVDFVIDGSESMFLDVEKANRTLELLYFVESAASREGASLRVAIAIHEKLVLMEVAELSQINYWLQKRNEILKQVETDHAPNFLHFPFRSGSMRVILSDLLFPGSADELLRALSGSRGRPFFFVPFSSAESDPDWLGNLEFVDCESTRHYLRRVDEGLQSRYQKAYFRHFEIWKAIAQRYGSTFCRVPSSPALAEALTFEAFPQGAVVTC